MNSHLALPHTHKHIVVDHSPLSPPAPREIHYALCPWPEEHPNVLFSSSGRRFLLEGEIRATHRSRFLRGRELPTEAAVQEQEEAAEEEPVFIFVEVVSASHRVRVEREIGTLQALPAHDNLLPLIEAFELLQEEEEESGPLCLVFPAHDRFTLSEYLDKQEESLSHTHIQHILTQLVDVLLHCQRHGVAHGDVCPQNILVDVREDGSPHVYLIDFGAALHLRRHGETVFSSNFGTYSQSADHCFLATRPSVPHTPLFASPESLGWTDNSYFHPMMADVWSLGLVFFALLTTGLEMFEDQITMKRIIVEYIKTDQLPLLLEDWVAQGYMELLEEDAQDLLVRMLQFDPLRRTKLEEMFTHPLLCSHAAVLSSECLTPMP